MVTEFQLGSVIIRDGDENGVIYYHTRQDKYFDKSGEEISLTEADQRVREESGFLMLDSIVVEDAIAGLQKLDESKNTQDPEKARLLFLQGMEFLGKANVRLVEDWESRSFSSFCHVFANVKDLRREMEAQLQIGRKQYFNPNRQSGSTIGGAAGFIRTGRSFNLQPNVRAGGSVTGWAGAAIFLGLGVVTYFWYRNRDPEIVIPELLPTRQSLVPDVKPDLRSDVHSNPNPSKELSEEAVTEINLEAAAEFFEPNDIEECNDTDDGGLVDPDSLESVEFGKEMEIDWARASGEGDDDDTSKLDGADESDQVASGATDEEALSLLRDLATKSEVGDDYPIWEAARDRIIERFGSMAEAHARAARAAETETSFVEAAREYANAFAGFIEAGDRPRAEEMARNLTRLLPAVRVVPNNDLDNHFVYELFGVIVRLVSDFPNTIYENIANKFLENLSQAAEALRFTVRFVDTTQLAHEGGKDHFQNPHDLYTHTIELFVQATKKLASSLPDSPELIDATEELNHVVEGETLHERAQRVLNAYDRIVAVADQYRVSMDASIDEGTLNQQADACLDRFAAYLEAVRPQEAAKALQDLGRIVLRMERQGINTDQITELVFNHLVENLQRLMRRVIEAGARGGFHENPVLVEMTVVLLQRAWLFLLVISAKKNVELFSFLEPMIQGLSGVRKGYGHYFSYGFRFYVSPQNATQVDGMRQEVRGTPLGDLWEAARGLAEMLRNSVQTSFDTIGSVGGDDFGSLYWAKRIFTGLGEREPAEEIDAFMNERHKKGEIRGGVEDG